MQDGNCLSAAGPDGADGPARRVSPAGYPAPKLDRVRAEGREQQDRACLGEIETVAVLAASVFLARAPAHPCTHAASVLSPSAKSGRPPLRLAARLAHGRDPNQRVLAGLSPIRNILGVKYYSKEVGQTKSRERLFAPFIPCHAHPSADISAPPLSNWGPRNRPALAVVSSEHPDLGGVCVCVSLCALDPGH